MVITFEALQQLFYIRRFDIYNDVSFWTLLKNQLYRWIIWAIIGSILITKVGKDREKYVFSASYFLKYIGLICLLVLLNILIISAIQLYYNGDRFSFQAFLADYIVFFTFQKGLIYLLGYSAITIVLHFYFTNEQLSVQVQKLSELKDINHQLYQKLKTNINDKTTVLNIKVGNKRKIIPIESILWIEADDYCVKVHLSNGNSYTMRSSLKRLSEKLQQPFLRVHRKAIVNMTLVTELNTSNTPYLVINNSIEIPVSKSNLKVVREQLS